MEPPWLMRWEVPVHIVEAADMMKVKGGDGGLVIG